MAHAQRLMPAIGQDVIAQSAKLLARHGYVRIPDFLEAADAEALASHLENDLEWSLYLRVKKMVMTASPQEQQSIGLARMEAMASSGIVDDFRYVYDVVKVDGDPAERARRGLLVDRLAEAWSTPAALAVWSQITGRNDLQALEMQATRYRPGHFLTRHDDEKDSARVAAFTLSLSRNWRAEWGGMLEFVDDHGDIERALTPVFNSLVLFNVPREHLVSVVAPFAPAPRLTVSGWLVCAAD